MKKNIFILILFATVLCVSCNDFLEENSKSTITTEAFYQDFKQAESSVYAIYGGLTIFTWAYPLTDLPTDEAQTGYAGDIILTEMANLTYNANNSNLKDRWQQLYIYINRANLAINKIPGISDMSDSQKNSLIAEARFLRGLYYFYLVRWFGDVPLVLDFTENINSLNVARDAKETVYESIVGDLKFACNNLPESYTSAQIGRVTRKAANFMLAKVYITMAGYPCKQTDKWQMAVNILKSNLASPFSDYLFDNINDLWLEGNENTKEHILSVQYLSGVVNNTVSTAFAPRSTGIQDTQSYGFIAPTTEYINTFDQKDSRLQWFKAEYPNYATGKIIKFDKPYCFKFFDTCEGGMCDMNWPILRYADVLLLYAEALNEISYGNSAAFGAINAVRNRAGLSNLNISDYNQESFRKEVLAERGREMCFEGSRWFDLVRTGTFIEALTKIGRQASEKHLLFPIPQREIDTNPELTQNSGY